MKMQKLQFVSLKTGNSIAFEDLVTVICTEFVKQNVENLQYDWQNDSRIPYLKKNFAKRRKISEKVIDSLSV